MPTGRRIYEEVWSMANVLLKNPKKISLPWWQNPDWEKILDQKKDKGMLEPFVLKYVDHSGYSCSLCNWTQKCSGCVIEPSQDDRQTEFLKYCFIAIEWHSELIEEEYNSLSNENLKHYSTSQTQIDDED